MYTKYWIGCVRGIQSWKSNRAPAAADASTWAYAQVDASAAAGARFDFQLWMPRTQPIQYFVYIVRVLHPDLLFVPRTRIQPARLGEIAVHIPFQERDVVFRNEPIQPGERVLLHVV